MRIFIVNLERSIDRKVALQERFAAAGITVEFMIAIDGKQLSEENIAAVTRKVNYAFLPGEIGCALSHQLIYRKMVEENIPEALILEDDVVLPDFLADLLATLPPFPVTPYVLLLSRVNQYHRTPRQLLSEKFAIHKVHSASTAHSYIINLAAAKNLLDALYPVWMTADKWTLFEDYGLMELDAVIPPPIILALSASDSTINQKKGDLITSQTKKELWQRLMKERPLKAKIREKVRRGVRPLFNNIIDQG